MAPPWSPDPPGMLPHHSLPSPPHQKTPLLGHDRSVLLNLIKSRGNEKNISHVRQLHSDDVKMNNLTSHDAYVASALISAYAKCGALQEARRILQKLPVRDVVSWSALIAGYACHGLGHDALKCFREMLDAGISPDAVTYMCVLKACGAVRSLEMGEDIDAEIRKRGLLQSNIALGSALVDMYAKCGALEKAREVFECLPERNVVSWSALIAGYVQQRLGDEALNCFRRMREDAGVCPDAVTYLCVLKACGITGSLEIGEDINREVRKQGLFPKNANLGTALVDMYAKCGAVDKAREVFEQLRVRDVVSWSALIAGYAQNGLNHEALNCFKEMRDAGVRPNGVTYICILKACGILGSLEIGEDICADVRARGLLQEDPALGNALVDMFSKCGALEKAQDVFEKLPERNVVSWGALIAGYAQQGLGDKALECFRQMENAGVYPDPVTYVCILKACGIVGSQEIGENIYAEIRKQGLLQKDAVLGTALIDMYSKFGVLERAWEVFEQLPERNVVSWSSLIAGYAQSGQADVALNLYQRMKAEGVMPDSVTFIILLNACSHMGLVEEGEKLFNEMFAVYTLKPTLEHYTCMIDLFGRAGHFDKARALLDKVPHSCHLPLFLSILGACRKWRNVMFGRWAFERAVELDGKCAAAYVCMGNMYAVAGMQTEADRIEVLRVKNKAWKIPGQFLGAEALI